MIFVHDDILAAGGFRRLSEGETYSANFFSLRVFALSGMVLDAGTLIRTEGEVQGVCYRLAVGNSVNAVCRLLVDDDWTDGSEEDWQARTRSSPPYAILHIGPTAVHPMTGAHVGRLGDKLMTFDGFPAGKTELRIMESTVTPSAMSAVALSFSTPTNLVSAVPVERVSYGVTTEGKVCRDYQLTGSAVGLVATKRTSEDVSVVLERVVRIAGTTPPDVARILWLGMEVPDPLKRFLFLFLSAERQVHSTFEANVTDAEREAAEEEERRTCGRNPLRPLAARFEWCVRRVWSQLGDDDVATFKSLKNLRDKIAHGSITEPPANSVRDIEVLVGRVLRGT